MSEGEDFLLIELSRKWSESSTGNTRGWGIHFRSLLSAGNIDLKPLRSGYFPRTKANAVAPPVYTPPLYVPLY